MESVTLAIAVSASALIFFLSPVYGLIVFVAAMVWYPSYMTVPIGTIDFTVCRIIILAVFANLYVRTDLRRRFRLIGLDKVIVVYFFCEILAGMFISRSILDFLVNRAGAVFDMVLPYFAVRMIIKNKQQYFTLLKGILIVAAPLAIIGLYQCLTGNNPFGFLEQYNKWKLDMLHQPLARNGFYRADVTFSVSIMYGLFFAMLGPVCAGVLYSTKKHKMLCWICLGLMGIGIFSSMSSGPWLAGLLSILFIVFYYWRKYWKPALIIIILLCGFVELISNRHFYDVIGDFTLNPATAWYRSRLISVTFFEGGMSGHWLLGFGYAVDPGWGPIIDERNHTDVVNHFIFILVSYGLVGLIPFLVICVMVVKKLINAYKISLSDSDKWLVWCLSAGLFGLAGAMSSVSLFGPPMSLLYILIAFCGAMPVIVRQRKVSPYIVVTDEASQKRSEILTHNVQELRH